MTSPQISRSAAKRDIAAGIVLFAASAVFAVSLHTNEAIRLAGAAGRDPGPGFLPWILIALLAVGAAVLALRAAIALGRTRAAEKTSADAGSWLLFPILMVATMAGYVAALGSVGFVASTAGFATLWSVLVGWQENGRPGIMQLARYLIEAALITALVWFVFGWVIKVPLP